MVPLRIAPIVEGHGEQQCIRNLIERIARELCTATHVDVLTPIRQKRHRLVKHDELCKAVELARLKLMHARDAANHSMVLVLLDADADPACRLGPQLLSDAMRTHADLDVACVLAVVEYETWFVGAAESLGKYLRLPHDDVVPQTPEEMRLGKGWIQRRFLGVRYSETQDQPAMTSAMDLTLCRQRCPSFDKLCREISRRL